MDVYFVLSGITFVWNDEKSRINPINHDGIMKVEALKKRHMTTITIRIPEDVIEDLKRVAPLLGFSGYQPLMRAYIGQGLRADLERLEGDTISALVASLKRHGVSDEVLQEALSEVTPR
jgi:predicted DNA binding CopG/RHH family protein